MINPEQKQKIVELIKTRDPASIALALELAQALGWPLAQTYQLDEWIKLGYNAYHLFGQIMLSDRALNLFSQTITQLEYLERLYIRHHQIQELPSDWSKLIGLQYLTIEAAALTQLPSSLGQLPKLQWLRVGHVKANDLSHFLPQCHSLQYLYLFDLPYLTQLPQDWSGLKNLSCLILYNCPIQRLPQGLGQLPKLQELQLTWNKLLECPPWLGRFAPIKLVLSYHFAQADYAHLPQGLGHLHRVRILFIRSEHWLEERPQSAALWLKLKGLSRLRSLSLQRQWLSDTQSIPVIHPQLRQLNLSENQISTWPKGLGLKTLILNANRYFEGGMVEWQLAQQLKHLELAFNGHCRLPQGLSQLEALEHLDLRDNQLSTLPNDFSQLKNLQYLNLANNPLKELPEALRHLTQLRQLSLVNCGLSALPDWFAELENIETLCLSHNNFEVLPAVLAKLPKLRRLYLRDVEVYQSSISLDPSLSYTDLALQQRKKLLEDPAFQDFLTQVASWTALRRLELGWQYLIPDQIQAIKRVLNNKVKIRYSLYN